MRTTADAVREIVEVDDTISTDLVPFITIANELVTEFCAPVGYSDARLELIERWLAAHYYTVRDNRVKSEAVAGVSATYSQNTALNLASSMQGQTAMSLDTAGGLAALNKRTVDGKRPSVEIGYLGTKPCEVSP